MPMISRERSSTPNTQTPPFAFAKDASSSDSSLRPGPATLSPLNRTSFSSRKLSSPSLIFSSSSAGVSNTAASIEAPETLHECVAATLHHLEDLFTNIAVLQTTGAIDDALPSFEVHHKHKLRVSVHDDIRVVSHDDHLPPLLALPQLLHDEVVDEMVVEIILGLVEHERLVAVGKEERQDCGGTLTGR